MANEGELPDLDLKMPSMDLELPEPTLNLDIPDMNLDVPTSMPAASPAPKGASPAGKPAAKPAGKQKNSKGKGKKSGAGISGVSSGVRLPVVLSVLCIVLLLVIVGVMYVFNVPVNAVPDLSLTTYVQSLWLVVGCFFVVAMLHDLKLALILTGLDIAMLITIFPTLMLLMNTPMNPMYFFVMGMIVLQLIVAMPLSVINSRKQATKKIAPAGAGASSASSTGPRTTS